MPGDFKEQRGHVHPDYLPFSSDPLRELEKGLPSSAPDIEDNVSGTQTQGFDSPQPQWRKLKVNKFVRLGPRLCVEKVWRQEVR